MLQTRRFSLSLTDAQLDALRIATDAALNVPAAEATERAFGRESALEALHGRRVLCEALSHDAERSVAKARSLDPLLHTRTKRRSGVSNWPRTREARAQLRQRTAERRAAGLPAPPAVARVAVSGDGAVDAAATAATAGTEAAGTEGPLSPAQREAIRAVAVGVAHALGVPAGAVSPPDAMVQMLATDSQWFAEARAGLRVEVALRDGTRPPEFDSSDPARSAPLAALEAVAFDRRARVRRRQGDWRRALVMGVRA